MLRYNLSALEGEAQSLEESIDKIAAAVQARTPTAGDTFRATVDGQTRTSRADTAAAVRDKLTPHAAALNLDTYPTATVRDVLQLGGHTLDAKLALTFGSAQTHLELRGVPVPGVQVTRDDLASQGHGLITKLENALGRLDQNLADQNERLHTVHQEIGQARDHIGAPFERADALRTARSAVTDLIAQMAAAAAPRPQGDSTGITPTPTAGPAPDHSTAQDGLRRVQEQLERLRVDRQGPDQPAHRDRHDHDRHDPARHGPARRGPTLT